MPSGGPGAAAAAPGPPALRGAGPARPARPPAARAPSARPPAGASRPGPIGAGGSLPGRPAYTSVESPSTMTGRRHRTSRAGSRGEAMDRPDLDGPRILFLDDDPARAALFAARRRGVVWVQTAEQCVD